MSYEYDTFEKALAETFYNVDWTHKIQEKQADIYTSRFKTIETLTVIVASLTAAGIISLFFSDQFWIKLCSTFLSFGSFFLGLLARTFDYRTLAKQHKTAANHFHTIRDELKLLQLETKLRRDCITELFFKYENLVKTFDSECLDAPQTTDMAVRRAKNK